MPLKYFAPDGHGAQQFGEQASIMWVAHGWVFIVYVVVSFLLWRQTRWSLPFAILVLVSGLIPLVIFYVERVVTRRIRAEHPELAPHGVTYPSDGLMTTAFVLGGGGVLGAVEVGMLRALFEVEIAPDLVLGTSVGALNGAMVARDPTPAVIERLTDLWQDAEHGREVYSDRPLRTVRRAVSTGTHLYSSAPLQQRLVEEFGETTLRGPAGAVPGAARPASSARPSTGSTPAGWSTRSWPAPPCPACCRRPRSAASTSSTAAS